MASKKTNRTKIDPVQRELIEKAQARARQKRRLYQHFILFLIGAAILILLNVVFDVGQDVRPLGLDWFVWIIGLWAIVLFFHIFNVFVTNKFLGKDWENRQVEKLVEKQRKRIDELQQKVAQDYPIPDSKKPTTPELNKKSNTDLNNGTGSDSKKGEQP